MIPTIHFGTSGHRGIINQSFLHKHVQAISIAIATLLKETHSTPKLLIGYDPRHGNIEHDKTLTYPYQAAQTLLQHGCDVHLCTTPIPTPCISWTVANQDYTGGLILTASHNPPEYNGLKYVTHDGAPAPIKLTKLIEKLANTYLHDLPKPTTSKTPVPIEPSNDFALNLLEKIQENFPKTNWSQCQFAVDCKHGAAGTIWSNLQKHGIKATLIHSKPDPKFGGQNPNPSDIHHLQDLIKTIQSNALPMGVANDPDADRHIILDETGTLITPEEITAILGLFFSSHGHPITHYITTLASSRLIRVLAKYQNATYTETPVGFKHFTQPLTHAKEQNKLAFAVESSGGFTSSQHILEKCGFYPALLLSTCLQHTQKPLSQLKNELSHTLGQHIFQETVTTFKPNQKKAIQHTLQTATSNTLQPLFLQPIQNIDKRDGLKINFKTGDWLALRLSGTEPVIRLYAESATKESSSTLLKVGQSLII